MISSLGLLACLASGCATFHLPWDQTWTAKATPQNPVVQIICIWQQAEGRDPEGMPCRGFAGQILFLANRNAQPVEIEGDVRIYLFDNVGSTEEQSRPLRQFDFDNGSWKLHLTKSAIGPSYSVFVPYVRRGQLNAQCTLRVRLTPKDGPTIFSEFSSLPLKGPATVPETTMISQPADPEIRVQAEVNQSLSPLLQRSTTIPLPTGDAGNRARFGSLPTSAAATVTDDGRLDRMEQLMQQILEERRQPATGTVEQASFEIPAEDEPPRRFKLDAATIED
jgi:hypothetical protein